ncbi:hypothetical protein IQ06DRAFT_326391 [Phaeosphaeriaceae sp. SRC1lsM3a]|nr:hypothetical protein IQ06DRAFT_326391 [Stagonospora sp. SRC1lsM3a]
MQQYPQAPMSPDVTGQPQQQPPVYHQDPNAQYQQQQQPQYAQHPPQQQFGAASPPPQQYPVGSPPPQQHPDTAYMQAQQKGMHPQQPGMPPQQPSGQQYQSATPIANLNRGPAPADCPACGQRSMTNTAFETGNTTHAWALGLCCLCCLGCIPYVMNSLKDVQHKCGRCGVLLATWHRSGTTEVHIHS